MDSYLYTFDSSPAVVLFDVHVNFCIPDKTERKGEKNVEGDSCVYSYEDKKKNKNKNSSCIYSDFKGQVYTQTDESAVHPPSKSI